MHLVGKDIPAGRYYAAPGNGCYWERLSGLGGTLAEVIANDFISNSNHAIVDVKASDVAFSTDSDCGIWYTTPRLGAQAAIPSGTWLVGTQVTSGTYRANVNSGCYWERLRDFTGNLSAIIANNFVGSAGPQLVTISATDVGFTTDVDCGTWTRVSSQSATSTQAADEMTQSSAEQNSMMRRSLKDSRLQIPQK